MTHCILGACARRSVQSQHWGSADPTGEVLPLLHLGRGRHVAGHERGRLRIRREGRLRAGTPRVNSGQDVSDFWVRSNLAPVGKSPRGFHQFVHSCNSHLPEILERSTDLPENWWLRQRRTQGREGSPQANLRGDADLREGEQDVLQEPTRAVPPRRRMPGSAVSSWYT